MGDDHVEPFDLMYNIQLGKAVISFLVIVSTNQLSTFLYTLHNGDRDSDSDCHCHHYYYDDLILCFALQEGSCSSCWG